MVKALSHLWKGLRRLGRAERPAVASALMFGVGTSDHQFEAYDPLNEDIRDVWDRDEMRTARGQATDFWNRYLDDIALASSLGCQLFRFSISWARVEPTPGVFDTTALDHYREIVEKVRAAGMEPMITLHHFVWPNHVQAQGGLLAEDFPSLFASYAARVVDHVGHDVRYWITINEPNILLFGFIKPWWHEDYAFPPGLPPGATVFEQVDAVARVVRNLFLAHLAARSVLRARNPAALVGANPSVLGLPSWVSRLIDRNATKARSVRDLAGQGRYLAEAPLAMLGDVDVLVATLTRTAERSTLVNFSEVYYISGLRLLVPAASPVASPDDLAGYNVVVVKTSTAESRIRMVLPMARARAVSTYPEALAMLDQGQALALLADDSIVVGLLEQHPNRYRRVGELLTDEPYAAAVQLGDPALLDAVDNAVRQFKESGEWARSYARHFPGEPVPEPPQLGQRRALTDRAQLAGPADASAGGPDQGALLRRIRERGQLIVGVKADVPGFGFRDPATGVWQGFEIDLARAIAQAIVGDPNRIVLRPVMTAERIPRLRSLFRFLDPLLRLYSTLTSALFSDWWHLGMAGQLPEFLCPPECVGQQDFVGIDYYWGLSALRLTSIRRLLNAIIGGQIQDAPVYPEGLYSQLTFHAGLFPDKPILVIENGSIELVDGIDRPTYLRRHVQQVQRARRDGINVAAHLCWSITSNREWGLPFGPSTDFGLYHVGLDDDAKLTRHSTPSADAYRQLIAERGA